MRPWPAGPPASPVLLNPGQICYMNAAVILLHWLVQVASRDLPSPYGVFASGFWIPQGGPQAHHSPVVCLGMLLRATGCARWHPTYMCSRMQ